MGISPIGKIGVAGEPLWASNPCGAWPTHARTRLQQWFAPRRTAGYKKFLWSLGEIDGTAGHSHLLLDLLLLLCRRGSNARTIIGIQVLEGSGHHGCLRRVRARLLGSICAICCSTGANSTTLLPTIHRLNHPLPIIWICNRISAAATPSRHTPLVELHLLLLHLLLLLLGGKCLLPLQNDASGGRSCSSIRESRHPRHGRRVHRSTTIGVLLFR